MTISNVGYWLCMLCVVLAFYRGEKIEGLLLAIVAMLFIIIEELGI